MDLFLSLLPALVVITLVIITRKVLISLGVGIILASFIYAEYNLWETIKYIVDSFLGIILSYDWYLPIIGFVVIIGGITAVITLSGGIKAFADWSVKRVKNPVAAQLLTWVLGLIIMIDDYFNALVIGEVSKPITDEYKISRAKLAYLIDSTSAPVVILMPISTWGAYIIGLIGGIYADRGFTAYSGFSGFMRAIPFQFYPITAIIMVYLIVKFKISFGPMKKFEEDALAGNDETKAVTEVAVEKDAIEGTKATHWQLIIPISVLLFVTFFVMFIGAGFNPAGIMDQEITVPLFLGGFSAYITAVIFALCDKGIKKKSILTVSYKGMLAMAKSAVAILILAWMVSNAIQDLGTGELLADYISNTTLSASILPLILFFIAGGIAFATGTSWGSFGILLPIAIPIALATDVSFMPAIIAAVLGGAVFGDHSSPVSDTTVLSATGARSTLHSHFISQLPYALITAAIAAFGYLIFGLTEMLILGYVAVAILIVAFVFIFKPKKLKQ